MTTKDLFILVILKKHTFSYHGTLRSPSSNFLQKVKKITHILKERKMATNIKKNITNIGILSVAQVILLTSGKLGIYKNWKDSIIALK